MADDLELLGCEPRVSPARQQTLRRRSRGVGLLLVVAGITWAVQMITEASIERHWPAAVVIGGATLWAFGFLIRGDTGRQWMAILGAAVLVTGGIVYCQVLSGNWEAWWYAWPLVIPLSVGLAVLWCAAVRWAPRNAWCVGARMVVTGAFLTLVLFLVLGGLVGIGDLSVSGRWPLLLPLSVALAGAAVALWPRDQVKRFKPQPSPSRPPGPP